MSTPIDNTGTPKRAKAKLTPWRDISIEDFPIFQSLSGVPGELREEFISGLKAAGYSNQALLCRGLIEVRGFTKSAAHSGLTRFTEGRIIQKGGNSRSPSPLTEEVAQLANFSSEKLALFVKAYFNATLPAPADEEMDAFFQHPIFVKEPHLRTVFENKHIRKIHLIDSLGRLGARRFLRATITNPYGYLSKNAKKAAKFLDLPEDDAFPNHASIRIGKAAGRRRRKTKSEKFTIAHANSSPAEIVQAVITRHKAKLTRQQVVDEVRAARPDLNQKIVGRTVTTVIKSGEYSIQEIEKTSPKVKSPFKPDSTAGKTRAVIEASIAAGEKVLTLDEVALRVCVTEANPTPSADELRKARAVVKRIVQIIKYPYKRAYARKGSLEEQERGNQKRLDRLSHRLDSAIAKYMEQAGTRLARTDFTIDIGSLREKTKTLGQQLDIAASEVVKRRKKLELVGQRLDVAAAAVVKQRAARYATLHLLSDFAPYREKMESLRRRLVVAKEEIVHSEQRGDTFAANLYNRLISAHPLLGQCLAAQGIIDVAGILARIPSGSYGDNADDFIAKLNDLAETKQAYNLETGKLKPMALILVDILGFYQNPEALFPPNEAALKEKIIIDKFAELITRRMREKFNGGTLLDFKDSLKAKNNKGGGKNKNPKFFDACEMLYRGLASPINNAQVRDEAHHIIEHLEISEAEAAKIIPGFKKRAAADNNRGPR